MSKTKIHVVTVGQRSINLDLKKVKKWKSSLFEIVGGIESYALNAAADGPNWSFTDRAINNSVPEKDGTCDFSVAIVNVPLKDNWYTRRLSENRVVFTLHEIEDALAFNNIPLENVVYRLLYAFVFVFRSNGNRIPEAEEITNFTHDETKGCIFDMNGLKWDIIHSCHNPIICPDCVNRLTNNRVSSSAVKSAQNEIKRIRKPLFYVMSERIKEHPIWSLFISAVVAILLGAAGSVLGSYIYEFWL